MKRLQKTFNYGNTPSFHKKDSNMQDSVVDPDCDFIDDLIDQFNGISIIPGIISPSGQRSLIQDSVTQQLRNIQNIENNIANCNTTSRQPQESKITNKLYKNDTFETGHFKSPYMSKCQSNKLLEQHILEQQIKRQKKLKNLKQILEHKQMQQCTFTPNSHLRSKKSRTPTRNLQQFLRNQTEYVQKIEKKRQHLKRKADQIQKLQQSFHPKINKTVQHQKSTKPAHERLYQLKQKQNNPPGYAGYTQNPTFNHTHTHKQTLSHISHNSHSTTVINKPLHLPINMNMNMNTGMGMNVKRNTLYEDAQRRNNQSKIRERKGKGEKIDRDREIRDAKQGKDPKRNRNNQKYGAQKFIKEFCYVLQCGKLLGKGQYDSMGDEFGDEFGGQDQYFSQRQFTFQEYKKILRGLGFVAYEDGCDGELVCKEKNLIHQGYQMLEQYGVNIRNLCVFLLGVLGIFNINPINFYNSNQISQKLALQLDQKAGRKLQKHFDLLYRNRLQKSKRPFSHSPSPSPCPLPSYLSPSHKTHTDNLASKYRSKMIERANERFISNNIDIILPNQDALTHQDLLVIDCLGKDLERRKLKEQKEGWVDEECTFYPRVNGGNLKVCRTDRGVEKSRELYEHAKSRHEMDRHTQSTYENNANHERSCQKRQHNKSQTSQISKQNTKRSFDNEKPKLKNNLSSNILLQPNRKTFDNFESPKLASTYRLQDEVKNQEQKKQKFQTKKNLAQPADYAKDVDKAVARMALGRKQRQFKNRLLARGQPDLSHKKTPSKLQNPSNPNPHSDLSFPQFPQSMASSPEPFLVIDVNMGDEMQQIQFYSGDEKKLGKIVDQFCIDHDLDDQCKEQLLRLVEIQMSKYLEGVAGDSTQG